jgi:hypothetical protein
VSATDKIRAELKKSPKIKVSDLAKKLNCSLPLVYSVRSSLKPVKKITKTAKPKIKRNKIAAMVPAITIGGVGFSKEQAEVVIALMK